jgi:hypothetical protein
MSPTSTSSTLRRERAQGRPAQGLGLPLVMALALALAGPGAVATASAEAERLKEAVGVVTEGNQEAVEVQRTIDTLSDEADTMASEYRAILDQIDDVEAYVTQVEQLIEAQGDEVDKLRNEIDEVEVIGRGIPALMVRMVEALDEFVELDIPFMLEDRRNRVIELRRLLARSDVTDAEKFRRILEAYQIENEFGRTIEAYRGTLDTGGEERTVDFLRIGRIALLYQTNDTTEAGAWSVPDGTWVRLGDREHNAIRQGLRIASKQAAPDLISVPLPRPVDVASEDGRTR